MAYTAIAMASGVWLAVDWTMLDNEEPFDDIKAAERDWIAVQLPIPVDPALDAQVLHRVMRIMRELAAIDMPDGLTVACAPRTGPASSCGHGSRRRGRRTKATENPHRARSIVCEAPVAAWQGVVGLTGQRGAIPLWGPESKERAIIAHMTHWVRQRLRETGYGLCTPVTGMQEGSGNERMRNMAWAIAATGTAAGSPSRRDVKRLLGLLG